MYEYEEVPEAEAKNYAKEIDAIFQTTSAKVASGIDELFKMIGNAVPVLFAQSIEKALVKVMDK